MQTCCPETQANASDVLVTKLRTIWIADVHRDDGKRFVVHAEEKLTAFMELEAATRGLPPSHL
jgi:hypothetical protein